LISKIGIRLVERDGERHGTDRRSCRVQSASRASLKLREQIDPCEFTGRGLGIGVDRVRSLLTRVKSLGRRVDEADRKGPGGRTEPPIVLANLQPPLHFPGSRFRAL
jgi:hypothetical protein